MLANANVKMVVVIATVRKEVAMKTIIGWVVSAVASYYSGVDFFIIFTAVSVALDIYSEWFPHYR